MKADLLGVGNAHEMRTVHYSSTTKYLDMPCENCLPFFPKNN